MHLHPDYFWGGLRKRATVANRLASIAPNCDTLQTIVLLLLLQKQLQNLEKQTEMYLKSKCSSSPAR